MAKRKAGEGQCPVCHERIVWRLSDSGAVSCMCQDCDLQVYAKDGTEAKRSILASMGVKPEAAKPVEKPEASPAPKPAPKTGLFGGLGL